MTEGRARPHKIKVGHGQDWGLQVSQQEDVQHFNKNKDNTVQAGVSDLFK